MFKIKNMKSIYYILIITIFILNNIPLFNCRIKEKKETYYTCKGNKVENITQNLPKFTSVKVSNTKLKGNPKDNNVKNISALLQIGIQNTINTFNVNSERNTPIYFEKSPKFFNADLTIKRVTFKAIFPENFLNLRKLYNTAQEFNESFTSSSLIEIKDDEKEKNIKIMYTSDYKYIVHAISKNRQEILSSILFDSFSHFCTFPNSLLPKYSGLYYIKQECIEYYFVIIKNIYPISVNDDMISQYFLNGSDSTAITTYKFQNINFQLLDNNFIEKYPKGLKVPSHELKSLINILERDTMLLAKLKMINYNFVLIICESNNNADETEESSRKNSDLNENYKPIRFNDNGKIIIVHYGIIDTLFSYNLKKKVQNAIGCISNDTVKNPTKYQKRFMQFITSKVFKSD